jgi:hypothetical protein
MYTLLLDLINATGSIKEVLQIILKEFEYQSSLELDSDTFDSISHIPVATQIGIHARQVINSLIKSYIVDDHRDWHDLNAYIGSYQ